MHFRIVGFTVGILLLILGAAMLVPAFVDFEGHNHNAHIFLYCALMCCFFGGALYLSCRGTPGRVTPRDGFLLTVMSWFVMSLFAAFPLYLSDLHISLTDAVFESVSGITTTGSTVLSGLDQMSHGILVWRSITQWIGGIGLIGFAIVILPFLRIGGMQLFRTESSDRYDKAMPKTGDIIAGLLKVYCGLTALCTITYHLLGMSWFDAVNHAMTTLSTGGYSTHDASFGFFKSPPLDTAAILFMTLGGLPFVLYVRLISQRSFELHRDGQVRGFLGMFAFFVVLVVLWLACTSSYGFSDALRVAAFNIMSVMTTTGFASADYTLWGSFSCVLFFFMTYMGACAGSTSGGIKTVRLMIAAAAVQKQVRSLLYPHGIFEIKYNGKPVPSAIINAVLGFLCLFVTANVVLTGALAMTGLDFVTAVSGAATALANVGPGLGDIIGPSGNFSSLPAAAKWLLCAGMLLGRLEIMTVLVILTPGFWKT